MSVADIVQLVGTLGFPIVACAALFWENHVSEIRHNEEAKSRDEAIANNTRAIQELTLWLKENLDRQSD